MLLAALANFQHHSFGTLLGVATLGNTLGGMST
jgi:membrane protein YqaA with SNARE-associated domain